MKILFLAASPMSLGRMELGEEMRAIEAALRGTRYRDAIELHSRWAIRATDLQRVLLEVQPTVVHFSGHGGGAQGIVLQSGGDNDQSLASTTALTQLFAALKNDEKTRLIVLNTCHSAEQAQALVEVVDFAIGTRQAVKEKAARVFAASFYQTLAYGRSIQAAFDTAISQLELRSLAKSGGEPRLWTRAGLDPRATRLVGSTSEEEAARRPGSTESDLSSPPRSKQSSVSIGTARDIKNTQIAGRDIKTKNSRN